jgi:DinB superfamily
MMGRPLSADAAPYYFIYINQVTGEDPIVTLENQLTESPALFSAISEEKSLRRYAQGKWSIRQVLNHVTDTERAFAFRTLWFARGFDTPLASYDQNVAASGAEADRVSWAAHVEEFRRVRLSSISLFRNMPAEGGRAAASAATIASACEPSLTSFRDTLLTTSPCCASGYM